MATVFLPSMLRELTGGRTELKASGQTVAELLEDLDRRYPGLRARLVAPDGESLKGNLAVAVGGEVSPLGLLERVDPEAEVHFVPAISGG